MKKIKLISYQQAIEFGWSKPPNKVSGGSILDSEVLNVFVGRKVQDPDKPKGEMMDEVLEHHTINLKTNKKEVMFERDDYKKLKKKLKINEYEVKPKSET